MDRLLPATAAVVSDARFARRAYLDLWGLLPSPEELNSFVQSRESDKRERLVRELLRHNANYAEHWITFWNDLLRNDEGVNYHGGRKSITGWLRKALEENLPYDQFVSRLLNPAGEGDPDGFLLGVNWRGDINASQTPVMQAAQNSAQVFLGVNLKCNSCHDSFISRWSLADAYGLASFFTEEKLELVRCDVRTGKLAQPKFLFPALGRVDLESVPLADRRAKAAELFTRRDNTYFTKTIVNRMWKRLMGRGLVEPVDDIEAPCWNQPLLDYLADDFANNGYDLKHLIGRIMTARAYQSSGEPRRMTAEQFSDALASITGEWRPVVGPQSKVAEPAREWRHASNPLTRSLGRPIRDQVVTERLSEATMLQALELANGLTLARMVDRGAKRLLGQIVPAPQNLFDSGRVGSGFVMVDLDITGIDQIWLVLEDWGSYSPERVLPVWAEAELIGPQGSTPWQDLGPVQFKETEYSHALRAQREISQDIAAKGYTRFRAVVGVERAALASDINPAVRFFVFSEKPDRERLVRLANEPPNQPSTAPEFSIERLYRHALSRDPTERERALAQRLTASGAEGLADLIWSLAMLPEFQFL
ncbi:MAG: DUF1549 domain-containing protein [Bryobacteraceae bacterium]